MTLNQGDRCIISKRSRKEFESGKDHYKIEGQWVRESSPTWGKRPVLLSITHKYFCLSSGCWFWCVLKAATYGVWRLGVELQACTDGASSQMRRSIPGWNRRLRHADLTTCVMASALGYCSNISRSRLGAASRSPTGR